MFTVSRQAFEHSFTKIQSNEILYILWGTLLLFLTSQVSIPLEPVPITLQTFGVMLIGLTFPRKTAIKSILTYLGMGFIGIPVFAKFSAGYLIFLGPRGGYLIGFLFAIIAMTSIRRVISTENILSIASNCLIGTCLIYAFGILGLMRFMDFSHALEVGLLPFILPGIVKVVLLGFSLSYLKTGRLLKW